MELLPPVNGAAAVPETTGAAAGGLATGAGASLPPVAIASELEAAGSSTAIVPSMVTLSDGATAELLAVVDAGGGLATGAAPAAAFLSLSVSAAASRPLLAAAFCASDGPDRFGICGAQASWSHSCVRAESQSINMPTLRSGAGTLD